MSETYVCDHCGSQSTIYTHSLGKGLVFALLKFKRAVIDHDRNSIHTQRDMNGRAYELSKSEYANWTMLRYHALVAKDDARGKGYWLLTRRGNAFIKGAPVPAKVRVLNNEVLHDREPDGQYEVTITELLNHDSRSYFTEIEQLERERLPLDVAQTGFGFDVPSPRREIRDLG
jgi:hypothetical protein